MAELIWRLRTAPRTYRGDLLWVLLVGGAAALVLGYAMTVSLQAACALALVVLVIALYQQDDQWGLLALLLFWLFAPLIRRLLGLMTGPVSSDPLSVAPFMATAAIAGLALVQTHVPSKVRVVLLLAAGGFALGLPVGFIAGPQAAIYAFVAYTAAVSAGVLGYAEGVRRSDSMVRKVLIIALPIVAAYAIAQHYLPLTPWDQHWVNTTDFNSIGTGRDNKVRSFGTLNSPGTLGALLAMSLFSYLTVVHHRFWAIAGATIVLVGLSLTFVRSAWWALVLAGLAHVIASRGESARVVLGACVITVVAAIALSPVSSAARDVVNRFESITHLGGDRSATDRQTSFSQVLPKAVTAPAGHGLGTAGESTKLGEETALRYADNGYLSLMYQVGPLGFLLVVAAMYFVLRAAWKGARDPGPGQQWRLAMFAILVYVVFMLPSGDTFYGSSGIVLWFIAGSVLAYEFRPRPALA